MWRAGYDIEAIKRRGRWASAKLQWYLRGGHRVLASTGVGMETAICNTYKFAELGGAAPNPDLANVGRARGRKPWWER